MTDDTTPATKADIKGFVEHIDGSIKELYDANERWKDEILDEVKRHFDVAVEDIRHDLAGANRDEINVLKDTKRDHEKRISRLEQHAGVGN